MALWGAGASGELCVVVSVLGLGGWSPRLPHSLLAPLHPDTHGVARLFPPPLPADTHSIACLSERQAT